MTTREILSYLVALLPAVYVGWWGRRLLRRLDDPLFPELYFKKTLRLGVAIVVGLVASAAFSGQHFTAKAALIVFTVVAVDFFSRRRIFRETWGLGGYLLHGIRFLLAALGSWILTAWGPELVLRSGAAAPATAVVVVAAVALWTLLNARVFPTILGASPLRTDELEPRFARVLETASCRVPALVRYGPRGGTFVNAFALPSLLRPAVLFTDDLLEALGPRETTAIFAHEVAHLEHHDRGRLLRVQGGLILLLTVVVGAVLYLGPDSENARLLSWSWTLFCLLLLIVLQARNQKHEHESDLRAVELGGDPRALIDALTKIHFLTRMPRRWSALNERRMSHPSLAQRLRAIREAAGLEQPVDDGPGLAVRAADDPGRAVLLTPDRLCWLNGLPADVELDPDTAAEIAGESRALPYAELIDLRLESGLRGRHLRATDRHGRTTKLALRPADVAAVKTAVERVDARLLGTAREPLPEVAARTGLVGTRVVAALATLLALFSPSSPVFALTTLLVVIRPARATLTAAGVVGIATAVLGWLFATGSFFVAREGVMIFQILRALVGVVFLAQANERRRRSYPDPAWTWWLTAGVLAAFATLSMAPRLLVVAGHPHPLTQLHLWIRGGAGAVLLLLGLAAVLWTTRRLAARLPALVLVASALLLAATGTLAFRERFGDDPLGTLEPKLALVSGSVERVREIPVGGQVVAIALSPSGERLAYEALGSDRYVDYGSSPDDVFVVEGPDGRFVELACSRLEFLDDERVLTLAIDGEAMVLSLVRLDAVDGGNAPPTGAEDGTEPASEDTIGSAGEPAAAAETGSDDRFELRLPRLTEAELRVAGEGWEVHGTDRDGERRVRLAGRIGETEVHRDEWRLDDGEGLYLSSVHVDAADRALAVGHRYGVDPWTWMTFAGVPAAEIRTLDDEGSRLLAKTSLSFSCLDPAPGQHGFHCLASDSGHTQVWSIESESGRFVPLGSLPGEYRDGLVVAGGRLLVHGFDAPLILIDPARGRAADLDAQLQAAGGRGDDDDGESGGLLDDTMIGFGGYFGVIATRGDLVAVLHEGDESRIAVYRLPARLGDERADGPP